ncbi:MAG: hypothetical protein CM15mP62_07180 [Rhodospirillaceae bacterium]|nr:MAG: hypothetical protein CM15mP62_07180 [Rhodospirillaceae bacterium]
MERKNGELVTAEGREKAELLDVVLDAAEQCGYPKNADYNSGDQEGFWLFSGYSKKW